MKTVYTYILGLVIILFVGAISTYVWNNSAIVSPLETQPTQPTQSYEKPNISILPKKILPGDPILVTVNSTSTVNEILFDGKKVPTFFYNNKSNALIAIDLNEKVLKHTVEAILANGEKLEEPVILTVREKIEMPLGIPEKLGGNTTQAETSLLANLSKENYILNTIKSAISILWKKKFVQPLVSMLVTDDYGYDRKTVNSTIVHKGTDFRARVGTKVMAMNDGVVKIAREFIIYGNTIVIDHGLGLQTLYMHLSKLNVKEGDRVVAGQVIGLSGQTGYADQPHLHISVKINGVSVDPMVFMGFFR